jgi:rhomboid protease GluP
MSARPSLFLGLIAVNALIFSWESATGALKDVAAIVAAGALSRAHVLRGEVWRLLSAVFLHASPAHLIGNCVVLYIVGMACQHAFGWSGAAVVYLVSGLCGSALSMVMTPGPSVGASGAIFGVTGAVVVFFYRYQRVVMLRDKRIGFVLLLWSLYQIFCGFRSPMIDNFAHIGGFLGGALAAQVLPPALWTRQPPLPQGDS